MTGMLSTIISYIPASLMGLLIEQEAPPNEPIRRAFQAAVLFADVSGFTPLTEALAQKGDEGPEEITRLLNRYFGRMIELLESEGGDVVKFSGDALTVLFTATDEPLSMAIRRAQQAAYAMQDVMRELAPVQTSVGPVELALKVGIGGGEVLALQVGGVFRRWEYVITGEGLRQAALAEGRTARGGVTLSPEMEAIVHPSPLPPRALVREALEDREDLSTVEARLKRFLPGAVRTWMVDEELHDWLGVLRTMSVLFIGVAGIDYDDEDGLDRIHTFLRSAQETIYRYQGSINKLAVDDKGTIFLVLFGAPPFAHADDPLRAVRCALDLAETASEQGLVLRTGITTGRVFAGPVGSDLRREYTVMGDAVNLAARLMGKADANKALCDSDTMQAAKSQVEFDALAPVMLKGKSAATPIFAPLQLRASAGLTTDDDAMIGRSDELHELLSWAHEASQGHSHMVLIEGDAGIGKTMLLRDLREQSADIELRFLQGAGQSLEQLSAYRAWRDVFSQCFGLRDIEGEDDQRAHIIAQMEARLPDQQLTPLLGEVLGIPIPDNEITRTLDPAIKQESLRALLISILTSWSQAQPLCLIIENLQWLDSLSWELLLQLCRALRAEEMPLFVVLSSRPMGAQAFTASHMASLQAIEGLHTLSLPLLSAEETLALVAARLGCSPMHLPNGLEELVFQRSDGNPLFAGELIEYLQQKSLLQEEGEGEERRFVFAKSAIGRQLLPDSLEGLLLARIDQLPPGMQLVLKVASVVGRRFSFGPLLTLLRSHAQTDERELQEQLESLQRQGLTVPEFSDEVMVYLFKNLATQEVTYRTLLYQQRRELHRTFATWLELSKGEPVPASERGDVHGEDVAVSMPGAYLPTMCHHWHHAGHEAKERWYTEQAGAFAASQYANAEAIQRYSRALELALPDQHEYTIALLLAREALHDRVGLREAQRADLDALEALKEHMGLELQAQCALREAGYADATSAFDEARQQAEQAATLAREAEDFHTEALALQRQGAALLSQGALSDAEAQLTSAIDLARSHQLRDVEAATLRLLGNCNAMRGDFHKALALFEEALSIHEQLDDHANSIKARNNIGLVRQQFGEAELALEAFEKAHAEAQEIGSPPLECLVAGNLATAYIEKGDYPKAEALLHQALRQSHAIDSPGDVGFNYLFYGENSLRMGAYEDAVARFHEARKCSLTIGQRYMEGYAHLLLAEAHVLWAWATDGAIADAQGAAGEAALQRALDVAAAIEQTAIEADAQLVKGYLDARLQRVESARAAFARALELFGELGLPSREAEARAGLIRLAGEGAALADIEPILTQLDDAGIIGMREPFWVCVTCLQVLQAAKDERLATWLTSSQEQLLARANALEDPLSRQRYLAIPHHQALLQLADPSDGAG